MGPVRPKYVQTVPFEECCRVQYSFLLETDEVVATKDIAADTWIDTSSPIWDFSSSVCYSDYTRWRDELVKSFNRYAEQSESVVAYSNTLSPQFHPPMTRDFWIEQMWLTNSWRSMLTSTRAVVSVVNGSKFNHSCDANLFVYVDHTQLRCRTTRNIRAGESLTVSYLGNKMRETTLDDRRRALINWHFKCTCDRCEVEETVMDMISELEQFEQMHL